jgi:hypothetical protein
LFFEKNNTLLVWFFEKSVVLLVLFYGKDIKFINQNSDSL